MINFDQLFDVFWETTSQILCTQNMVHYIQGIYSMMSSGMYFPGNRLCQIDNRGTSSPLQICCWSSSQHQKVTEGHFPLKRGVQFNWFSEEKRFVFSQFFFLQFLSIFTCNYLRLFTLFMNDFNTCIYLNLYYCNNLQAGC